MHKLYYVNRSMCGGDNLPPDFDLEEFCEILQTKVPDVEIVPVDELSAGALNLDPELVPTTAFYEALGEYCHL